MFNVSRVMAVAAHPDDEVLGCGGLLARLAANGGRVAVLLLGEGPTARGGGDDVRLVSRQAAREAALRLGVTDVRFESFPDNRFDSAPLLDIVRAVESHVAQFNPELVLTHHAGDLNVDHMLTQRAVLTALRPLPGAPAPAILGFETLSSTEWAPPGMGPVFTPTVYADIAAWLPAKLAALEAYAAETRPWPHPRSPEAVSHLAALRGSQCGREAAEAFVLYRSVS